QLRNAAAGVFALLAGRSLKRPILLLSYSLLLGANVAFFFEAQKDFLGGLFGGQRERVDDDFSVGRHVVGVADASEFFDDAGACLGIKPFAVALFTFFNTRVDMHEDEATMRGDHRADFLANVVIRCDRGADANAAVLGDLGGDEANAADIDIAVLFRET